MASREHSFDEISETLKTAGSALRDNEIPYLLGGSLAFWAHGGPERRKDLDFMVKPEDAERALQALEAEGMSPEKPAHGWPYKARDVDIRRETSDAYTRPVNRRRGHSRMRARR